MKTIRSRALLLILTALVISCRPDLDLQRPEDIAVLINSDEVVDFSHSFEAYWQGMNHNYLFWDKDPTDWDAVYDTYSGKFKALGYIKMTDTNASAISKVRTAHGYFTEMTRNLIDGHYSLSFNPQWAALEELVYQTETIFTIMPVYTKVLARPERPTSVSNIDQLFRVAYLQAAQEDQEGVSGAGQYYYGLQQQVIRSYWNSDSGTGVFELNTDVAPLSLALGHIDHSTGGYILYFSFSGFAFNGVTSAILTRFFNELEDTGMRSLIEGIIVDVRGNRGGSTTDLNNIWGRFIDTPLTIGFVRYKSGEGRLDYTPPVPQRIINYPGGKFDVPLVLLVDKFSVSCAELSAMIVKMLPKGHVIGETTWGATSALTDNRVFNGGQFTGDALWTLSYTPSCMFTCADGNFYEGVGVPPDQEVLQDWELFLDGRGDNVLEAAITHLDTAHTSF
jgi:hypothetical protein